MPRQDARVLTISDVCDKGICGSADSSYVVVRHRNEEEEEAKMHTFDDSNSLYYLDLVSFQPRKYAGQRSSTLINAP